MAKRGQITIFIILGLVILFAFAFVFYTSDYLKKGQLASENQETISWDVNRVKNYVSDCLDQTLLDAICVVGLNDTQISNYVEKNLLICTDFTVFEKLGFDISYKLPNTETIVREKSISINLDFPITIKKQESTRLLEKFSSSLGLQRQITLPSNNKHITFSEVNLFSLDNGTELYIPAGTKIVMVDDNPVNNVSISVINVSAQHIGLFDYVFAPDGATFYPYVYLNMKYSDINNDGTVDGTSYDENYLEIRYLEQSSGIWTSVSTERDPIKNILKARITHFSEYGVAPYPSYSAAVYKIDPIVTPNTEIITLTDLDGSGYLSGKYVTVTGVDVYSANNIFVYQPAEYGSVDYNTKGKGFDAAMAYYSANNAANYFASLGFSPERITLEMNAGDCSGCAKPWLGYYGNKEIFIPTPVKGEPNYHRDTKGVFHEYTHYVYGTLISEPETVENEGYAIYFPSSYSNTSRYSDYLNPANPKNLGDGSFTGEDNPFAFASALWDVRSALGRDMTDQLIYYSWELQKNPSGNYAGRLKNSAEDGLVSLVEADWQLHNGEHASVIKEKFRNHGIDCESCIERQ